MTDGDKLSIAILPGPGWGDDGGGEDRTGSLPRPTPAVITLRADLGNRRNSQLHLREESDFPSGAWLREWRGALGGRSDAATLGGTMSQHLWKRQAAWGGLGGSGNARGCSWWELL